MRFVMLFITLLHGCTLFAQPMTVGVSSASPPFVILVDNQEHFYGFDIEIMNEICKRINVQCNYKALIFKSLFSNLDNGAIDVAIGDITITEIRQDNYLFSLPYLASSVQFITKQQSSIDHITHIHQKRIGIQSDTVIREVILEKFNDNNIKSYLHTPDLFAALMANEIDVILLDAQTANFWYINNITEFKLIDRAIPYGFGYGILASKDKIDLITRINKALIAMENDGSYIRIYNNYFNNAMTQPPGQDHAIMTRF